MTEAILAVLCFAAGALAGLWLGWSARRRLAAAERAGAEAAASARLDAEQALRAQALDAMQSRFRAASADALRESREEFLRQAEAAWARDRQTAGGELEKRQAAIQGMIKPLEEQLKTYQARLQQGEGAQARLLGEVRQQLETLTAQSQSLAKETQQFRMVLHSNQARGRWGEETLRRVVEAAGMSAHCDFQEQTGGEDSRPDLLVRLPGSRVIVVDAKVPDFDLTTVQEQTDGGRRAEALVEHAKKLRQTIRQLGARQYPEKVAGALDYVVLFLPAESLFSAALEGDRDLIVWAAEQRVMLATPASLIALLRAVSLSWQQYAQTENAQTIAAEARDLYDRVAVFLKHFSEIGAGLNRAGEAYRKAAGSYERRIRPSGERLVKLLGAQDPPVELVTVEPVPAPVPETGEDNGREG